MSTVLVDYSAEWHMLDLTSDEDWTDHSMDDITTWPLLPQPSGGDREGAHASVPGTETWTNPIPVVSQRPITTPSSAWWIARDLEGVRPLALNLHVDASYSVYFNGVAIIIGGVNPQAGATSPSSLQTVVTHALPRVEGRLAIRVTQHVRGGLDGLYIDPQVVVGSVYPVVRQYPRDDGAGLSSAPRLYPPPKRQQRLVGGFQ